MMLFADLQPLAKGPHADLRLQPIPGHAFARTVTEIPVFTYELPLLVPVLPLALRIADGAASLVGITGVNTGENVFVGPKGAWNAVATPEALTTYPFAMRRARDGAQVVCADMASALLGRSEGNPLLTDTGEPTATLQGYLAPLRKQAADRATAAKAIAALSEAGVLAPWAVDDVATLDGDVHYHVDLAALAALPPARQAELAQHGALGIAYAQAYAMANMRKLRRMARRSPGGGRGQEVADYLKGDDIVLDFGR